MYNEHKKNAKSKLIPTGAELEYEMLIAYNMQVCNLVTQPHDIIMNL